MKKKIFGVLLTAIIAIFMFLASCAETAPTTTSTPVEHTPTASVAPTATATLTTTPTIPAALLFPIDNFTVQTKTVTTSTGNKTVTYRFWEHITYVANPVDAKYESMNIYVPININGVNIDATNAPIFLNLTSGGYRSAIAGAGRPPGAPLPPGFDATPNPNADLALAAGYVEVWPGCRGEDNKAADGTFFGKAPADIVDLKCAVRYLHLNDSIMPGNASWIIASGTSASGALSSLLGVSGHTNLYDSYIKALGGADADDTIYAAAPYCPVIDLEHADMAYEWIWGNTPQSSGLVDQTLSYQLKDAFAVYQASLNLQGKNGFGTITAANYADYLLQNYIIPSANKYLSALSDADRASYLSKNPWLGWANNKASFTFVDFVSHVGRMKGLPAFDDFKLANPENILFGNATTDARHFTNFSLRNATGNSNAEIDNDLKTAVNLMNPMYFISQKNTDIAKYWFIRFGSSDPHTSPTVAINLATSLENLNKSVNTSLYWDALHSANKDPGDFIAWIANITGYTK